MQFDQVIEHALTDIGNKTLANPRHQVETGKGADGQRQDQDEKQPDGLLQRRRRLGGQALVDQQLDALAHRQGDGGGKHQRQQGPKHATTVRRNKAPGHTQGIALTRRQDRKHGGSLGR